MPGFIVREARIEDAAALAEIYNQGIADRIATFETEGRSAADIEHKIKDQARYPIVVAAQGSKILAAAWTSQYRARSCYDTIAEFSVYVERSSRGKGFGRAVMDDLIRVAEQQGLTKLVSRIFPENGASRALCLALGFREVGVYKRHGKLDGVWKDCVIVEKLLGEAAVGE